MYVLRRQSQIRLKFVLLGRGKYQFCHTETRCLWRSEWEAELVTLRLVLNISKLSG